MAGADDWRKSRTHRAVTALFGLVFVAIAIAIVVSADRPLSFGPLVAALAVGALGVDACLAAVRGRKSLLERIGPLP
jgi:hypothetical protein